MFPNLVGWCRNRPGTEPQRGGKPSPRRVCAIQHLLVLQTICNKHVLGASHPSERGGGGPAGCRHGGEKVGDKSKPTPRSSLKLFKVPELCYLVDIYGYFHLSW